jgi:NAD+ diphosphatase
MIVAVVRDGRLLLAQSVRYRGNMHSVLAGFVEPGETLEECVRREVYEEVGVRVKNLRYFGSQSWPFPHSLMVAFTAEHESGEIAVDQTEIRHAFWCPPDELPEVPNKMSVSRRLIDWFVETYGGRR